VKIDLQGLRQPGERVQLSKRRRLGAADRRGIAGDDRVGVISPSGQTATKASDGERYVRTAEGGMVNLDRERLPKKQRVRLRRLAKAAKAAEEKP